ncbi:Uncharacterised protein (plasmid) [Legionella adelaidensis]|uniref:Uncharacterized protein n=1 Tax=Legionella adelaidensis TaxID=45056 RepID=A0A0W0R1R9_9GAMM|nr:hypothetical protein [Legionella adelaidensis]KTC65043.1 hypothetical protein Lade_1566 [Legionella adelaidensis]VEH85438.1 Uncharacterised protein [Legionella adelaidensis]
MLADVKIIPYLPENTVHTFFSQLPPLHTFHCTPLTSSLVSGLREERGINISQCEDVEFILRSLKPLTYVSLNEERNDINFSQLAPGSFLVMDFIALGQDKLEFYRKTVQQIHPGCGLGFSHRASIELVSEVLKHIAPGVFFVLNPYYSLSEIKRLVQTIPKNTIIHLPKDTRLEVIEFLQRQVSTGKFFRLSYSNIPTSSERRGYGESQQTLPRFTRRDYSPGNELAHPGIQTSGEVSRNYLLFLAHNLPPGVLFNPGKQKYLEEIVPILRDGVIFYPPNARIPYLLKLARIINPKSIWYLSKPDDMTASNFINLTHQLLKRGCNLRLVNLPSYAQALVDVYNHPASHNLEKPLENTQINTPGSFNPMLRNLIYPSPMVAASSQATSSSSQTETRTHIPGLANTAPSQVPVFQRPQQTMLPSISSLPVSHSPQSLFYRYPQSVGPSIKEGIQEAAFQRTASQQQPLPSIDTVLRSIQMPITSLSGISGAAFHPGIYSLNPVNLAPGNPGYTRHLVRTHGSVKGVTHFQPLPGRPSQIGHFANPVPPNDEVSLEPPFAKKPRFGQ